MKRINNSNFELIEDIIQTIDFKFDASRQNKLDCFKKFWKSITGNLSEVSRVYDILEDDTMIVICKDSFVTNELYLQKNKLLKKMEEKMQELGITIKDIKFNYKKWKDKDNEQEI